MENTPVGVTTVCALTGLPVLSIPTFTDVEIYEDCIVTIKKIGESVIYVDYRGKFKNCKPEKMDEFFRTFCKTAGITGKYVIVINLRSTSGHMPVDSLKSQVSILLSHDDSLSGIVLIQAYTRLKKLFLKGLRFFNPGLKIEVKEDYATAVFAAMEIINEHKINSLDTFLRTSEKKLTFEDVFFNPDWEYHNEANLRYRLGGIRGKLFYISMHGNITEEYDIHQCGALLEKVIKENNFSDIPFVMVDYTELAPISSIRLRHLFVKEAERVNRLYGHDKSIQIAIKPDKINRIAIRLFAPFIQQRIILVDDLNEAFIKLNSFITSGISSETVRDIVVSKKDLKELANAFGAMHWREDLNFPDDFISRQNPLSCLSDSLVNMKNGLTELIANETLIQKQRLKESEIAKYKIAEMLQQTEKARNDLEKSEISKRILLDNISTQIWYLTDGNTYGAVNKAHACFIGKEIEELAFKTFDECLPLEKVDFMRELSRNAFSGENLSSKEKCFSDSMGNRYFSISQTPVFHSSGTIDYVVCCAEDITDRKIIEAERERLTAELIQSRKLESIGRLAGGVAHDFNNMLAVILGHVELAMSEIEPSDSLYYELSSIQNAAERSADLTRQLLAFARKQIISPKVIDINSTISGMLGMLHRLIGEDVELIFKPFSELWSVKMDPTQVDQIIANLCLNSRDALGGRGHIHIETNNFLLSDNDELPEKDMKPGKYVILSVSDNGSGMSDETLSHIFEPFFTTKGQGKGTGLGLATTYGAVKQNNGFIKVNSAENQGTQVMIFLPVSKDEKSFNLNTDTSNIEILRGYETVLLVEDELMILNVTAGMLENLGYKVLKAQKPKEALDLCKKYNKNIDLLMTDVIMPGMNGSELSNSIREIRPTIHRLFMSGYTADIIASKGILEDGVNFIHKPFSMSELSAKIRSILESA